MSLSGILDMLWSWGEKHITKVYGDNFMLEDSILNDKLKLADEPTATEEQLN